MYSLMKKMNLEENKQTDIEEVLIEVHDMHGLGDADFDCCDANGLNLQLHITSLLTIDEHVVA